MTCVYYVSIAKVNTFYIIYIENDLNKKRSNELNIENHSTKLFHWQFSNNKQLKLSYSTTAGVMNDLFKAVTACRGFV